MKGGNKVFNTATVTGADTIASLMTSYGPVMTIISVFLMLFVCILFFLIRNQQKSNENIMNEHKLLIENLLKNKVSEEQEKMYHTGFAMPMNSHSEHLHIQETIKTVSKISRTLKEKLEKHISEYNIARGGIYLFHNGHYSLSGFPFFKFSCICEYVSKFTYARMKSHNQFPVNLMSDFMTFLLEDGLYYLNDDNKNYTELDPIIEKMLTDKGHPFIIKGIRNTEDDIIGFLICEYESLNREELDKINGDIITLIKKIAPILEFSNINYEYKGGTDNEA